ncbi:glycosyltransferase family 4 protein [Nanoarchaeota archaeon]
MLNEYRRKFPFVKYYGKIKRTEIPKVINKYDLIILPSLHNSAESFPNVLLEAMACEKPVIGTNVHGIPEMIENGVNGFLIPQKSSLAIRKVINKFIETPLLIRTIGKKGRKLVKERFEKEKQIQKLYNVLLKIRC